MALVITPNPHSFYAFGLAAVPCVPDGEIPQWYVAHRQGHEPFYEQYLEKREQRFREQTAEFENVVSTCPDPETLVISDYAIEQKKLHDARIDYLPVALKLLKEQYPNLHCLIIEYFCTDKKVTMIELGRRHGLTVETVRYRIKSAKEKLKGYIILHETGM